MDKNSLAKFFGAVLVIFFSLTLIIGCSTDDCESDDCNVTIVYQTPDVQGVSGVSLNLWADHSIGMEGTVYISLLEGDTDTLLITEDIVVDVDTFSWELDPGYYLLKVGGTGFYEDVKFSVYENLTTVIGITLQEDLVVTWDLTQNIGSPSGLLLPWQTNTALLTIDVAHNWDTELSPSKMTFFLDADENAVEIPRCQLDYFPDGVRTTLGGAPNSYPYQNGYEFTFEPATDSLDPTFVSPGETTTYQLLCDIGEVEPGARLRAHLIDFDMAGEPYLERNIPNWPHGNWLWYPTNTIWPSVNSQSPSGLKTPSFNQDMMFINLTNDSLDWQTVTELSFELRHAAGFNVNSCYLESNDHSTTYHGSIPPDTSGAWPTFTFSNMTIYISDLQTKVVHLVCDTTGSQTNAAVQPWLTDVQATIPVQDSLPLQSGGIAY
ncbi:hypothetical protein ACFL2U_00105 [Patescibacteria group bacterium]